MGLDHEFPLLRRTGFSTQRRSLPSLAELLKSKHERDQEMTVHTNCPSIKRAGLRRFSPSSFVICSHHSRKSTVVIRVYEFDRVLEQLTPSERPIPSLSLPYAMGTKRLQVQVIAFTLMALFFVAMGQGGGNCPALQKYFPCLNFVHNDDKLPGYNDPCCDLIRTTSESCLCTTAQNNGNVGIVLEKALKLPKACGRQVPPNTYCGDKKVPS